MATTLFDEKISSFIEDKFPEFVRNDHPVFVEFLRLYYQFMEAAKITLTNVQFTDDILLENLLTTNFLLTEDGTKIIAEDSAYGAFLKDENIVGQTSGAIATILAEDNAGKAIYIEQNRHFQVGEVIVGSTSTATATISKYQGNPIQNLQQLLEYSNVDKTLSDLLNQMRDAYLVSIPDTLSPGVSKRNLIKNVRDLYRSKGTKKGHEAFFRLLFGETPEIFYPTDQLLKISAGEWTSDTIIRIVATEGNPTNLVGQLITQTIDSSVNALEATAYVEGTLQFQEGETTVYQLLLNLASLNGTFVVGGEVTGIDNSDSDVAISGIIQTLITNADVVEGGSLYTTADNVTITSDTGKEAQIDVSLVGQGELDEVVIDNVGTGYNIGQEIHFDNTGTFGAGAQARIVGIGGALTAESGDSGQYGMSLNDHILFEDATEQTDTYTGGKQRFESGTFMSTLTDSTCDTTDADATVAIDSTENLAVGFPVFGAGIPANATILSITNSTTFELSVNATASNTNTTLTFFNTNTGSEEETSITDIFVTNKGSGYKSLPNVLPTTGRVVFDPNHYSTSGKFQPGEIITSDATPAVTATVSAVGINYLTLVSPSGTFGNGNVITGGTSEAVATLTSITNYGTAATLIGWSESGIGAVKGVEVTKFGTGFASSPILTLPVKMLITRNVNVESPPNISLSTSFAVGDIITGDTSSAVGEVTVWDNTRQTLTIKVTANTFQIGEVLQRGSTNNYAIAKKIATASLTSTIGTIGTTAGSYESDKGKISDSLMKIQDSYYYQDFSYVVRLGAAISSWRGEAKKAIHPAGFAMFGEVSITNKIEARITSPVEILGVPVSTVTPELASIFEAALTTVIGRRLGTADDGTTILGQVEIKATTDHGSVTLKRGSHLGHKLQLTTDIESITRSSTVATVTTPGPHGIEVGELVQISGVTSDGYNGTVEVTTVAERTFTYTVSGTPASPAILSTNAQVLLISPFDNETRDLTFRSHKDINIYPYVTDRENAVTSFASLQANRYGLGPSKANALKYLWSVGGTSDTSPQRLDSIPHAYPNIIRRKRPETQSDNVDAGTAGIYDNTFKYTRIQIGSHEVDSHMAIGLFGGLTINEIMSLDSRKIWNVPPPSYIRLVTA